jgi:hypothetical protein
MTDAEKIAAFLATKGVTRLPEGQAALGHMRSKDWCAASKLAGGVAELEAARTQQRIVVGGYVKNDLGEWIAFPGAPLPTLQR